MGGLMVLSYIWIKLESRLQPVSLSLNAPIPAKALTPASQALRDQITKLAPAETRAPAPRSLPRWGASGNAGAPPGRALAAAPGPPPAGAGSLPAHRRPPAPPGSHPG